jgi:putative heme-binding domain-containing protein
MDRKSVSFSREPPASAAVRARRRLAAKRWLCLLLAVVTCPLASSAASDKVADDMSDDPAVECRLMDLPPGFEIQLVASEPAIVNPIQMNFDPQGRLWVACAPRYPQLLPGQEPADYIMVLDNFDTNGKARSTRMFARGLMIPTGLAPGDGGVYVAQADALLHFRDTKSGKTEKRIVLAGFGTQDTHHTLNTFRWGPDGALYFNQGIYIKSTVETPFGPRKLFGGCIWQLRTDRLALEVFDRSILDNNTWGHIFDAWGQSFVASAWPADINRVLPDSPLHQGAERALIPPLKLTKTGGGRHCGLELVSGRHFPDDWQGDLLTGDFLTHRVQRYRLKDDGRDFSATPLAPLVVSRHRKFRPVDVKMGPDGAIYIADLYQQIIQHNQIDFRDPRRDHKHGRIWRIVRKDRPLVPVPKLVGVPVSQVLGHLKDPEQWTRLQAKRALAERGHKEVAAELARWVPTLDAKDENLQRHLLEALWTYQAIDEANLPLLTSLLHSGDYRVRAAATRVLGAWSDRVPGVERLLAQQASDPHARVRLEAVLAAGRIPSAAALAAALQALDQPSDPLLDFALRKTVLLLKPYWYPEFQQGKFTFEGGVKPLTFALETVRAPDALPALAALYKAGKVPRENETEILSVLGALGDAGQQTLVFEQALARGRLSTAERARLLDALRQSAGARPVRPQKDIDRIAALFKDDDVRLSVAALRVAGAWKLRKFIPKILELASSPAQARRQAAIAAFVDMDGGRTFFGLGTLEALANDSSFPIRSDALVGLISLNVTRAAKLTVPLLKQQVSAEEDPSAIFTAFLHRAGGAAALAAALKDSPPSRDAAKIGLRVINNLGVQAPALVGVLQKASGEVGKARKLDATELRRLIDLVKSRGDPARGENVFRRPALGCMQCHAIAGAGGRVGPDLATIGASAPLDYLIESILLPSKVVKEGYTTANVVTKKGKVISGIVLRESPRELLLRDPTHDEIAVATADIDERQSGGSLMPNGLDYTLTDVELADLVRFLAELGRPGPYALSHVPVARRWQYLAPGFDTSSVFTKVLVSDYAAVGEKLKADTELTWATSYSRVSGQLPLSELVDAKLKHAFVRCRFDVATTGKLEIVFNDVQGLKLWVDGVRTGIVEPLTLELARGVHTLDCYVDLNRRRQEGLRCELAIPAGSAAQAAFVGGQ